jgi:acyl-phosphate glycerol 3-phosphate acyltransferase
MFIALTLTIALAYLIGALPLAYWYARIRGGEPRLAASYNIGLENTMRVQGLEVSVASFVLDFLKGVLAVGIAGSFEGNEPALLAGLAGYVGHLYPPPFFFLRTLRGEQIPIRGRGNVMILGVLAGLYTFAGLPFWMAAAPVVVWSALVAYTGLIALGTLAGVGVLVLELLLSPIDMLGRFAVLGLLVALVWRFKENIGRIVEKTEPRVGEVMHVTGENDNQIVVAFIIHPLGVDWFWRSRRAALIKPLFDAGILKYEMLAAIGRMIRPFKVGELRGIYTKDGKEIRCHLITGPFTPESFKSHPELATKRAIQGARLAKELGASVYGLGAFWGTVGKKGLEVQAAVPEITVTNGGAYTAGSVREQIPVILDHFKRSGHDMKNVRAAVVGANGVVAFGIARMIAAEVGFVALIGRDLERLDRSKKTLERSHPNTKFTTSIDPHDCIEADLIFTATSDPDPVIFARDVKPGTWIFDEGRPEDVDKSVLEVAGVRVIPGGVVQPPGEMSDPGDWAKWRLGFGDGCVPACLAETLIIGANKAFDRQSLGETTKTENINYFVLEARRLGFTVLEDMPVTNVPTGGPIVSSPRVGAVLN